MITFVFFNDIIFRVYHEINHEKVSKIVIIPRCLYIRTLFYYSSLVVDINIYPILYLFDRQWPAGDGSIKSHGDFIFFD